MRRPSYQPVAFSGSRRHQKANNQRIWVASSASPTGPWLTNDLGHGIEAVLVHGSTAHVAGGRVVVDGSLADCAQVAGAQPTVSDFGDDDVCMIGEAVEHAQRFLVAKRSLG